MQHPWEGQAEERLMIHDARSRVMEHGLAALGARGDQRVGFRLIHRGVEEAARDSLILGIFGVSVRHIITFHEQGRRFPGDVSAHAGFDVLMLHLERFDAQNNIKVGVQFGRGGLQIFQITDDAFARRLRDFIVVTPFADHVGSAIATDIKGRGVLEAGAAVIGPDGHVAQVGHMAH